MYNSFAKYYDILMSDVNYSARADYICSLFDRFGEKPGLLLDLACGTGSFSKEFAKRGMSVIGVDISEEMLSVAQKKIDDANLDVMFVCQPAQDLCLAGRVDSAVCLLDSLNHIIDYDDFCEVFVKVSAFLKKGGLFIFDMNTEFKHRYVLADNAFVIEENNIYCAWQNFYSPEDETINIVLDFFEKRDDSYIRNTENICERAYSDEKIITAAENAGLALEAVFGDMTFLTPAKTEQRKVFIVKKT